MTPQDAPTSGRLRDEAGFVLVEVLVSAALLILVGLSVFTTLDQSDKLAGQQARRAMAANMAQSELERIRALPIEDVANLRGMREVVPDASRPADKYYLTSNSKWVTDGADEPDCSTRSGGLDYMRVTTMVAWAAAGKATTAEAKKQLRKPVILSSVITPASRSSSTTNGSLSVNIDRADAKTGVAGLQVSIIPISGGTTFTETTNENGCVVFPFVPAGQYTLKFNRAGWVNQNSVGAVEDTVSVPPGATNKVGYLYDLGGTTSAKFTTTTAGLLGLLGVSQPTAPESLVLFNGDQTPGPIVEDMNAIDTEWNTGKLLFPAESPYVLYAGACRDNTPNSNITNVNITAGRYQNAGTIQLPAYDIRVQNGTASANSTATINDAVVAFYPGCGESYVRRTTSPGLLGTSLLNPRGGRLADPGFPYTTSGTLCVSGFIGSRRYQLIIPNVVNTTYTNPPIRYVYLGNGTMNGPECTA